MVHQNRLFKRRHQMFTQRRKRGVSRCLILVSLSLFILDARSTRALERLRIFPLLVQSATATLAGTVLDENGAIVTDVEVTVTNLDTAFQRRVKTNSLG